MKHKNAVFRFFIFLALFFTTACSDPTYYSPVAPDGGGRVGPTPTPVPQLFSDADRPFFQYNAASDYYYCEPWNYYKPENFHQTYPLLVFLHGSGGAGNIRYLYYLGYDSDDGHDDQRARAFQLNHPSVVLIPQTQGSWNTTALINLIEQIKNSYRIDRTRIYLIGYSMGGSGSYSLANAYYDHNGHLFAGIIRLAGQSQVSVRDPIAASTAVWLHVGLNDTAQRVQSARDAYDFLKNYHSAAYEVAEPIAVPNRTGTTLTLYVNGAPKVKKTEYDDVGHGIVTLPFGDPNVMEWLYQQHL